MLLLTRHGSTRQNQPPERLRGWQDLPLDQEGRTESRQLAEQLADRPIQLIWSSDFKRAMETAQIVAKLNVQHPNVHPTALLRPWDVGKYEGEPVSDTATALRTYIEHPDRAIPHGESIQTFMDRFLPFFKRLLTQARGGTLMAVTHTRNVRLALAFLKNPQQPNLSSLAVRQDPIPPGEFLVISNGKVLSSQSLIRAIPGGAA